MKTRKIDVTSGVEDLMVVVGEKNIKSEKAVLFPVECELPEEFTEIPARKEAA